MTEQAEVIQALKAHLEEEKARSDRYRNAGAVLAKSIVRVIAYVANSPASQDFTPAQVLVVIYRLLNEPRVGNMTAEDVEVQNLARVKIDAMINEGGPSG